MRIILYLFLLSVPLFSLFPEDGKKEIPKERIVFKRVLKKGDFFSCFARVDRTLEYTLALPGASRPIEKRDSLHLSLAGILQIRGVNKKGQAEKISLYISSISGSRNGRELKSDEWRGRELLGDLSPALEQGGARFHSPSLKRTLTPDEIHLFRALFPGGDSTSLAAFTSPVLKLRKGETFPLQLTALEKSLAARKIAGQTEKPLTGMGEYQGRVRFRGIDTHKLRFNILSRKVPGYDLRYQAEILLPVKEELGGALQIYRNGREFINKLISSSNQFAAGARLSQLISEEASITLLPESSPDLPGRSPEKKAGFHQLLRPPQK